MFKVFVARQLFKLGRTFIAEKEAKLDNQVDEVIDKTHIDYLRKTRQANRDK
jgi:hypothetical protein